MQIYLLRHGETRWNVEGRMQGWGNSKLTTLGQTQARKHGELLAGARITKIYASDLGRVSETLAGIREFCDAATYIDSNLRECNLGQWEGLHVADIRRHWLPAYQQWRKNLDSFAPPGGESKNDMKLRIQKVLHLLDRREDSAVAFVTHGITTRVLLDLLLGITQAQKQRLKVPHDTVHVVSTATNPATVKHVRHGGAKQDGLCTVS